MDYRLTIKAPLVISTDVAVKQATCKNNDFSLLIFYRDTRLNYNQNISTIITYWVSTIVNLWQKRIAQI